MKVLKQQLFNSALPATTATYMPVPNQVLVEAL